MSPLPRPSWKLLTSLLMLSLVPLLAGMVRLSGLVAGANGGGVTPGNARFMANPAPVVLHVLCASVFCVLGALQFDSALRQPFPRLHRIAMAAIAAEGDYGEAGRVAGLSPVSFHRGIAEVRLRLRRHGIGPDLSMLDLSEA